jgi:5-methylcytosine-specific restriction endonuclease McrA
MLRDMDPALRRLIIQAIRTWFPRTAKYKAVKDSAKKYTKVFKKNGEVSKKKSVSFKCNICKDHFKSNEVEVDHKKEIVDNISSSMDMSVDQYVRRVDCPQDNLQVVCKECHKIKTKKHNETRVKRDRVGNMLSGKKLRKKSKKHLI